MYCKTFSISNPKTNFNFNRVRSAKSQDYLSFVKMIIPAKGSDKELRSCLQFLIKNSTLHN